MRTLTNNIQGLLIFGVVFAIAGFFLLRNIGGDEESGRRFAVPNPNRPTQSVEPAWLDALAAGIDNSLTRVPTEAPPTVDFVQPTANINPNATIQFVGITQVPISQLDTPTPLPTSPFDIVTASAEAGSRSGSTAVPSPTGIAQDSNSGSAIEQFQPPPEQVPLALHPYDHFYFRRPVDASGNSASLFYYPYGARWQETARVHHGIDIPNPIGEQVLAAADGVVFYSGRVTQDTEYEGMEVYASYGNVVVIEHDFTVDGKPVFTLYAHLAARSVATGARVFMGDVIGLVGDTGVVTGAHIHFEVRHGENTYWNTRNPLLWIAPYINHGVIAGRIVDAAGDYIDEVTVQLSRGGRIVDRTVTYAQPLGGTRRPTRVVPDDNRQENFVFGDVPVGTYQVIVVADGRRFQQSIDVLAGRVNWVPEFRINPPESTPLPSASDS